MLKHTPLLPVKQTLSSLYMIVFLPSFPFAFESALPCISQLILSSLVLLLFLTRTIAATGIIYLAPSWRIAEINLPVAGP